MTEEQAFQAIRNAIRLENLSRRTAAKVTPDLLEIIKQAAAQISRIDSGDILREQRVRQVLAQLQVTLRGPNNKLYDVLTADMRAEVEHQARQAEEYIKAVPYNQKKVPPVGITVSPATNIELAAGSVTRTQLLALVDETEVLGSRLSRLFGIEGNESAFINSQIKKIDQVTKKGFLAGETSDEIAKNIISVVGKTSSSNVKTIARTAVMDMSQRAHERIWNANSNRIALWEYDATFDYRVCPQCFPYDGKRKKIRSNLPDVPRHPNCRCRVIPVTKTQLALEKEDWEEGMTVSTVQVGQPLKSHGPIRPYKTRARFRKTVKGKQKTVTMEKFAQDIQMPEGQRPSMGFFLLKANNETREAVLGKKNAKRFFDMIRTKDDNKAVLEANQALRKIIKKP